MDEPEYIDIPDVCRVCLARRGNVSIFDTDDTEDFLGYSVADRIMTFACVEVQSNDDLPAKICSQCVKQINQAFELKAQCEYADATLRELCSKDTLANNVICLSAEDGSKIGSVTHLSAIRNECSSALDVLSAHALSDNDVPEEVLHSHGDCGKDASEEVLNALIDSCDSHVPEEGIVLSSAISENKHRTDSSTTQQFYDQKNNTSDKVTFKIQAHKSLELAENVIACAECGEQFSNNRKMEEHGLLMPGHRPFLCALCWKTFKRLSNMKEHEKMHSGRKQFLCSDCGELATGKKNHYCMALHDKEAKGYSCNVCGKNFVSRTSLGTHKKRHETQSKFQCKECDKLYFSRQELERHLRVHFNIRPFNCPDESCSLTFFSQGELNRHLRYHEGLRRFSCDKCGQKFFESGHLACHQRKHTGERPYTCRHCPKSFTDSSKLRRHSLAHKKSSFKKKATALRNVSIQFTDLEIASSHEKCNVELEITVPQEDVRPEYLIDS